MARTNLTKEQRSAIKSECKFFAAESQGYPDTLNLFGYVWSEAFEDGEIAPNTVTKALENTKSNKLVVNLNSPGGDADAGIAIFNLLKSSKKDIEIRVVGRAASAASIIAMAASPGKLLMGTGSHLMIHRASVLICGNAEEMRKTADELEQLDDSLIDIYSTRTNLSRDELVSALSKETTYNREDAMKVKLADGALLQESESEKSAEEESEEETEETAEEETEETAEEETEETAEEEEEEESEVETATAVIKARARARKQAFLNAHKSSIPQEDLKFLRKVPLAACKEYVKELGISPETISGKPKKASKPSQNSAKISNEGKELALRMGVTIDADYNKTHMAVLRGEYDALK